LNFQEFVILISAIFFHFNAWNITFTYKSIDVQIVCSRILHFCPTGIFSNRFCQCNKHLLFKVLLSLYVDTNC